MLNDKYFSLFEYINRIYQEKLLKIHYGQAVKEKNKVYKNNKNSINFNFIILSINYH